MKPTSLLMAFSLLIISLAGCSQPAPEAAQAPVQPPDEEATPDIPDKIPPSRQEEAPQRGVKAFTMTAKQWEFLPETITVKERDEVTLTITSIDVTHGILLADFGVNVVLTPGDEKTVTFTADKKGTFPFICSVPCGAGHSSMRGALIVQ